MDPTARQRRHPRLPPHPSYRRDRGGIKFQSGEGERNRTANPLDGGPCGFARALRHTGRKCGAPHFPDAQRLRGRTLERGGRSPEGGDPAGLAGLDKTQRATSRQDSPSCRHSLRQGAAKRKPSQIKRMPGPTDCQRTPSACPRSFTGTARSRAQPARQPAPLIVSRIANEDLYPAGGRHRLERLRQRPSSATACGRSGTSVPTPL